MKTRVRFKVDKLIRDKIPDSLEERGVTIAMRIMNHDEYIVRLKNKLVEEAKEVQDAQDIKELIEEMGDLYEVMSNLISAYNLSMDDVFKAGDKKRSEFGSFKHKIYSEWIEMDEDNQEITYYKERADRYPEIDIE